MDKSPGPNPRRKRHALSNGWAEGCSTEVTPRLTTAGQPRRQPLSNRFSTPLYPKRRCALFIDVHSLSFFCTKNGTRSPKANQRPSVGSLATSAMSGGGGGGRPKGNELDNRRGGGRGALASLSAASAQSTTANGTGHGPPPARPGPRGLHLRHPSTVSHTFCASWQPHALRTGLPSTLPSPTGEPSPGAQMAQVGLPWSAAFPPAPDGDTAEEWEVRKCASVAPPKMYMARRCSTAECPGTRQRSISGAGVVCGVGARGWHNSVLDPNPRTTCGGGGSGFARVWGAGLSPGGKVPFYHSPRGEWGEMGRTWGNLGGMS